MLKSGSHIHLMGICGTAMASLAGMLKGMGYKITGSDQNVYPPMSTQLEELGISIMEGYKKENLEPKPDLVIVGNVITCKHEEAQALLVSDIPYTSLPKALGEFVIAKRNSIVLAGTHGKTTTTAIMAWIAECCDKKPGFLVGGIPLNFSQSFCFPQGNWFVIEGDEYDTAFFDKVPKFIYYKPKYVVLTSVEFDHVDIYSDLSDVKKVFQQLIDSLPKDGLLVVNAEDQVAIELASQCRAKVVTYGLNKGDYSVADRQILLGRNQFTVVYRGKRLVDIAIKLFGPHNTMNALAAFALVREMGWPLRDTLNGLASFKGVKRRQEIIGEPHGITVVEDFAHHPTAVELTLATMGERFRGRKIIALFEPRSATSRRRIFQQDYIKALSPADVVIVAKPYDQSKITKEERFSSEDLVASLVQRGRKAFVGENTQSIIDILVTQAQPKDVILIMSNGDFGGIYGKLLEALQTGPLNKK